MCKYCYKCYKTEFHSLADMSMSAIFDLFALAFPAELLATDASIVHDLITHLACNGMRWYTSR